MKRVELKRRRTYIYLGHVNWKKASSSCFQGQTNGGRVLQGVIHFLVFYVTQTIQGKARKKSHVTDRSTERQKHVNNKLKRDQSCMNQLELVKYVNKTNSSYIKLKSSEVKRKWLSVIKSLKYDQN